VTFFVKAPIVAVVATTLFRALLRGSLDVDLMQDDFVTIAAYWITRVIPVSVAVVALGYFSQRRKAARRSTSAAAAAAGTTEATTK
jgi:hypothetical protein